MSELIFANDFLHQHPLWGWWVSLVILFGIVIVWLSNTVSAWQVVKSNILIPLANLFKFKILVRAAIKSDVEGRINQVVDQISMELPKGWATPLSIKWVQNESKDTFFKDNKIVLRIKPLNREDKNFANALYLYIKSSFFPSTKSVLKKAHYEATTLQFCRRIIKQNKPSSNQEFEDDVMEPLVNKNNIILKYLDRLDGIDDRGLFTGIFIREIHAIAKKIKFKANRSDIGSEFTNVLIHLESFLDELSKGDVKESHWYRQGSVDSYGLLLVAHPVKAASGSTQGYINRAKKCAESKINHLYVFGTKGESGFVKEVVRAISIKVFEYELIEEFKLHKDYRGEKGGHGAMFRLKKKIDN